MGAIKVSIRGHAVEYFPGKQECFDFTTDEPLTIRKMLEVLGVNPLLIMMASVNGEKRSKDFTVKPDDEVLLFSPPSGG